MEKLLKAWLKKNLEEVFAIRNALNARWLCVSSTSCYSCELGNQSHYAHGGTELDEWMTSMFRCESKPFSDGAQAKTSKKSPNL